MAVDVSQIGTIYDKFMGTNGLVSKSLSAEYTAGRINGTDYATVFLGAIQTAMSLATTSVQNQEKLDKDIELTKAQTGLTMRNTAKVEQDITLDNQMTSAELALKLRQTKQVEQSIDLEKLVTDEKVSTEKTNQASTRAATYDSTGLTIDASDPDNSNTTYTTDTSNKHYHDIELAKQGVLKSVADVSLTEENVKATKNNDSISRGKMFTDTGMKISVDGNYILDALPAGETFPSFYNTTLPTDSELLATTYVPYNNHEASMIKSRVEANVAIKTEEGFVSDAFYKQSKSLQEFFFSAANSGIIGKNDTSGDPYTSIVAGFNTSLENQVKAFKGSTFVTSLGVPAAGTDLVDDL